MYHIYPNRSTVHECKGLGARLLIHIFTVNRNHMDLSLQGSGNLLMCGSQMDWNIAWILVFFDMIFFMFYGAFGVNLM